ncbi:MAG: ROK family protein [Bacteroidales bacterium]|nr:ROK family protein [Bacteroidales bacterium]MBN2818301.1 ROK family protein [Bacteroidales bacterium]
MPENKYIIGVDLGGTTIHAGLVSNGIVIKRAENPTQNYESRQKVFENLVKAIQEIDSNEAESIGIGLPGILNPETGIIHDIVNIQSWNGFNLKKELSQILNKPVYIDNDANCFALGSAKYGAAKALKHMVGLSLGTGLGAGIVSNGIIYGGLNNGAGEFGQIPYQKYRYEQYCSGQFFTKIKGVDGENVFRAACNNDAHALEIWREFGIHLGKLVINILYSLAPEAIVFGGSVSKGFPYFSAEIEKALTALPLRNVADNIQLLVEENEDIALLGAAAICSK